MAAASTLRATCRGVHVSYRTGASRHMFALSAKLANAPTRNRIRRRLRHVLAAPAAADLLVAGTYVWRADICHATSDYDELVRCVLSALRSVKAEAASNGEGGH